MIKRIINISEQAYLHVERRQLLIDKAGNTVATVPAEDLGVLILEHHSSVITQGALVLCQQNNVAVVLCDEKHLPYSVLLPLHGANSLHTKVIRTQIDASKPIKKRLWQQIVRRKIREQIKTLNDFGFDSARLERIESAVKSGDPENKEAQAARRYWTILMGRDFRRDTDADGINAVLNYGYAIVRAAVARAIVGTGLHPALGIHHSNQYNGLCLADDLMEPFRPWMDARAREVNTGETVELTREVKQSLLSILTETVTLDGRKMTFLVSLNKLAANLKAALGSEAVVLNYPRRTCAD